MSIRLADRSFQYPVGIAENMLVEVGKFTFPADFVILKMEEDISMSSMKSKKKISTLYWTKERITKKKKKNKAKSTKPDSEWKSRKKTKSKSKPKPEKVKKSQPKSTSKPKVKKSKFRD
ncbi:hypothetical protein Tco_1402082 [Tanacetum coccineum]